MLLRPEGVGDDVGDGDGVNDVVFLVNERVIV